MITLSIYSEASSKFFFICLVVLSSGGVSYLISFFLKWGDSYLNSSIYFYCISGSKLSGRTDIGSLTRDWPFIWNFWRIDYTGLYTENDLIPVI